MSWVRDAGNDDESENTPDVQFYGPIEHFEALEKVQQQEESALIAKIRRRIPEPQDPYVPTPPTKWEMRLEYCQETCTPPCFEDWTYRDFRRCIPASLIVLLTLFLVFVLPWLPMVFENGRECSGFIPDDGILGDNADSASNVSVKEAFMNFHTKFLMRRFKKYDSNLYDENFDVTDRYEGNKDVIDFEDFDPDCELAGFNLSEAVHFCVSPRNGNITGAGINKVGKQILIDIFSPQVEDLAIVMKVNLRSGQMMFPNIEFIFESVGNLTQIVPGTRVRYVSSKNSRLYVRRTNFERGIVLVPIEGSEEFEQLEQTTAWLGAYSPIFSIGSYMSHYGLDQISPEDSDEGRFHRLCVPEGNVFSGSLTDGSLDPIDFVNAILLSPGMPEKVAFQIRATTLYRDDTKSNRLFKISITVLVLMTLTNALLFYTDEEW